MAGDRWADFGARHLLSLGLKGIPKGNHYVRLPKYQTGPSIGAGKIGTLPLEGVGSPDC